MVQHQYRKILRKILQLALGSLLVAIAVKLVVLFVELTEYHSPWYLKGEQLFQHSKKRSPIVPTMDVTTISNGKRSTEEVLVQQSPASVQLGASKYLKNCISCHGPNGRADAEVALKLAVPPEDLNSWTVQGRQDVDLYRVISDHRGVFKDRFTHEELWGLVHYMRKMFSPEGSPPWNSLKEQSPREIGRVVYETLRCKRCHDTDLSQEIAGFPPTLDYTGSKLNRDWIVEYLLNPYPIRWKSQGVRPLIRMPSFRLERWEAEALGDYLAMLVDTVRFPEEELKNQGTVEEGRNLFQSYQCLGCHIVLGQGNKIGPELTSVGVRLKPAYMFQFVKDPQGIIPETAMRDYELWDSEASSLVRYLETLK